VIAALVAGLLAGYGIAMPVGAVATYLVSLTARTSLKTGAYAALGVATADGLYALVATLGGSVIAPLIEPITTPLKWISALVLIALAVRGALTAINRHRRLQTSARTDAPPTPARAYFGLLGMTMLNPTTVIYFTALVLGGRSTPTLLHQTVFVIAAFIASSSWQLLLAAGGALLGRALTSPHGRLTTALTSSLLITALATHLLLTTPHSF
jgi:arginine exporter protein ArgO